MFIVKAGNIMMLRGTWTYYQRFGCLMGEGSIIQLFKPFWRIYFFIFMKIYMCSAYVCYYVSPFGDK